MDWATMHLYPLAEDFLVTTKSQIKEAPKVMISVTVSGAGTEVANGTYVRASGNQDGVPYYANTANSLILCRYTMSGSGSKYWYIAGDQELSPFQLHLSGACGYRL